MIDNRCSVCREVLEVYFKATVLKKYEVNYYYCHNCGLLQTEQPYWTDEAHCIAISESDTGLICRNINLSKIVACLLYFLFDKDAKYLDIGGGYGLLTRLMRDYGFDFYWSDKNCENIFAKGFEFDMTRPTVMAATAFEVLEHIYDPIHFFRQILSETKTETIIFSTYLYEGIPPLPQDWWYYSFSTGQHISFYKYKTLLFIAKELEMNFYSHNCRHILTKKTINPYTFKLLTGRYSKYIFKYVKSKMCSKTHTDHEKLSSK